MTQIHDGHDGRSNGANGQSKVVLPRFELGDVVATPGAIEALRKNQVDAGAFLLRHQCGDWGDLSEDDKKENELSVKEGFRILSAYTLPDGVQIWVITEADRSVTTILLPDEY